MQYKEKTIKDIQDLFIQYKAKKMSKRAFYELAEIVNGEDQFNGLIKIIVDKYAEYPGYLDIDGDLSIHLGVEPIDEISREMVITNPNLSSNNIEAYNYWFLYFLLHEFEHLHQYCEAYGIRGYENKKIGQIYKVIFDRLKEHDRKVDRAYERDGINFNHERNANINTSDLMVTIMGIDDLRDSIKLAQVNHLMYINTGYFFNKKGSLLCPLQTTHKSLGVKAEIPTDFDLKTRIYHGLPISESEFYKVYSSQKELSKRDYDKEIRKLVK